MNKISITPAFYKSAVWFGFAALFLFFSNGKWVLPIAIWISTICLLKFSRLNRPFQGFFSILLIAFISNLFIWKGLLPLPGPLYQIINFISAIFIALPFLIDRLVVKKYNGIISTLIFPCAWVCVSFLYSTISPSGTFGSIAYSQSYLPLLQIISITGIWGLIFIIGWTATTITYVFDMRDRSQRILPSILIYLSFILVILLFGYSRLYFAKTTSKQIQIGGVINDFNFQKPIKENLIEFKKYSKEQQKSLFERTEECIKSGAEMVFWQETALVLLKEDEPSLIETASKVSRQNNVYIGLSVLSITQNFPNEFAENKIIWTNPIGNVTISYNKAYPTPAEAVKPGEKKIPTILTQFGKLSTAICFDMDFPNYISQAGMAGTNIICVPANDWSDIALYHSKIASFRSIEQGFSLVRVTGKGLSASYDNFGKQLSSLDYFKTNDRLFITKVPVRIIKTLYAKLGNWFIYLNIFGLFGLITSSFIKKMR